MSSRAPGPDRLSLLLVGGSGAVGREVLRLALAEERIERLVAPSRRPLPPHARLTNPVLDLATLPDESPYWRVDAVICTLGTTLKQAGSPAAFAAVDRDLPIRVARCARQAGATRFAFNSSLGASPSGNFYLRTKAEAEAAIGAVGYPSYTIQWSSSSDTTLACRSGVDSMLLAAHRLDENVRRVLEPHLLRAADNLVTRLRSAGGVATQALNE